MITLDMIDMSNKPSKVVEKDCQEHFTNSKIATKEQDINEHWDFVGDYENYKQIKVDVKSIKKINRKDVTPNENYHWIEIQNVRGNKGWLYGDADFIAFETLKEYIFVDRKKLIELIESYKITKEPEILFDDTTKELHKLYKRFNRQDIIILVSTSELIKISTFFIKKS
jgi:hypothetical protein